MPAPDSPPSPAPLELPKPTVPEVLPIVQAYYALPGNGVGGSLHIVLEDGNVEDSSVAFCLKTAQERGDAAGVELADLLLRMSRTQRKKLYRHDSEANG